MSNDFSEHVRTLAIRIAESGPTALGGLFDLTAQRLLRYAVTITRNQHDAEDVIQAILMQVAARPQLLSQCDQPWHYLLRMVRNQALLVLRERKRASAVSSLVDLLTRCSVDEIELEELHRDVWKGLRKLPAEQSEVIVLKIWEELTFAQIATVLDVSPSTIASRYRYAMEKLAYHLKPREREVFHE